MKRAYKLQEFVAHTSNVNCLQVGRKSAGVLVTGGEDKKVNVWAIGKPTAVLSLAGHQSPVECVAFDNGEEAIVAGATGGTIKLWDLEQAKVIRTLTGHRSTCSSIDFHPFGDFFASGSLDTTLKVWDIRRKTCINTYKGHSRGVTKTIFSPDGRLVASSTHSGEVKIWDLTAGKLLHEFQHDNAVTGIVYHPSELLLATSSADRTVKWWDLETFQPIDSTATGSTGVRSIAFTADGNSLLAATQDGLTSWAWEPVRRLDTVDVPWAKVQDMSVNQQDGKLVACSCNNSFVGVWVVDLTRTSPFASQGSCRTSRTVRADITVQDSVFSPGLIRATKAPASADISVHPDATQSAHTADRSGLMPTTSHVQYSASRIQDSNGTLAPKLALNFDAAGAGTTPVKNDVSPATTPGQAGCLQTSSPAHASAFDASSLFSAHDEADAATVMPLRLDSQQAETPRLPQSPAATTAMSVSPIQAGLVGLNVAAAQSATTGLDMASFMPPHLTPRQGAQTDMRDLDFLAEVLSKHSSMVSILGSRHASLQIVRSFWQRGDVRGGLNAVLQSADSSVAMDVCSMLQQAPQLLKLEHCPALIQCLECLVAASHKSYITVGVNMASCLLRTFGDVVQQTCQQSSDRMGVDVMFDERRDRCMSVRNSFKELSKHLQQLQAQGLAGNANVVQLQQRLLAL